MSDSKVQFGRIPYEMIVSGALVGLIRSDLATYLVIAAHANAQWSAAISIETIADQGGMGESTARKAAQRLQDKGRIDIMPGGGRGRTNTYVIVTDPARLDSYSKEKPCRPGDTVSDGKGCHNGAERVSKSHQKGVISTPKPCHLGDTRTEEQIEQTNRRAADAAVAGVDHLGQPTEHDTILAALMDAEIAEPTRSQLVSMPGVSAALVERVNRETRATGGRTGAVVENVRTASPSGDADAADATTAQRTSRCRSRIAAG